MSLRAVWMFLVRELVHLGAKVHLCWPIISVGDACVRYTYMSVKSRLRAELS